MSSPAYSEHWSEQYLTEQYVEGKFDCADLAFKVLHEQCDFDLDVPAERSWRRWTPRTLYDNFGERFHSIDKGKVEIRDFDVALMAKAGTQVVFGGHIGIVGVVDGEIWILHALKSHGVRFQREDTLYLAALVVEGYYRWQR